MATISTVARPAYVYDEVADTWFPVGAQAIAFVQTFEFTATASQTTFTGLDDNGNTLAYTALAVRVYLNGALLSPSTDYVASNGTSIVLSTGAAVGDILVAIASDTFEVANTYTQAQVDLITSNIDNTISTLDDTVVALDGTVSDLDGEVVDLKASSMIIVNHGTDPNYARPTGVGAVYWIGSAEPVNAEAYDMWWSI